MGRGEGDVVESGLVGEAEDFDDVLEVGGLIAADDDGLLFVEAGGFVELGKKHLRRQHIVSDDDGAALADVTTISPTRRALSTPESAAGTLMFNSVSNLAMANVTMKKMRRIRSTSMSGTRFMP